MSKQTAHWERSYLWGRALKIEAIDAEGGLNRQVERIRSAVGATIGSRNTFAKLFTLTDPPDPNRDPIDALRARLLVEAIGLEPSEWGVADVPLPAAFDPERVLVLVGGRQGEPVREGHQSGVPEQGVQQMSCISDCAGHGLAA